MLYLIFYGKDVEKTRSLRIPELVCHHCGKAGHVNVNRYVVTFNIFWIPLFPTELINEFECVSCQSSMQLNEMGPELKVIYQKYKINRIPIWKFSGVLLILCVVVYNWLSGMSGKEKMKAAINNNEVNRVCDFKSANRVYSSFKICAFDAKNVYVVYNNYQAEDSRGLQKIDYPENFSEDTINIERKEVIRMIDDNIIQDIHW